MERGRACYPKRTPSVSERESRNLQLEAPAHLTPRNGANRHFASMQKIPFGWPNLQLNRKMLGGLGPVVILKGTSRPQQNPA